MSVIIRDNSSSSYYIFCKGSPEKIRELCKIETIPQNFQSELERVEQEFILLANFL